MPNFRKIVWAYYRKFGRHDLPWRKTRNPYRILVSEVMLQQTQVERVIPFYKKFIKQFPTAKKLAAEPLSEVLKSWQGLGYNRRAKMLRAAAQELAARKISTVSEWETLPGVGPYTARAIVAFAYNQNVVFVETNIRTVVIHYFFPNRKKVSDTEIEKILANVLPKGKSRDWYSALMDYGAYLKRSGISHNARGTTYAKQSKFTGSSREARGAILRALAESDVSRARLVNVFGTTRRAQVLAALNALCTEGLVRVNGNRYTLAD
jgi:A/G-specific adenine glycosylase